MLRSKIIAILAIISLLSFYKPSTPSHAYPASLVFVPVVDSPEVLKTLDSIHKNKAVLDQKVEEGAVGIKEIKQQVKTIQSQTSEINMRVDSIQKNTIIVVKQDTLKAHKGNFLYRLGRSFSRKSK